MELLVAVVLYHFQKCYAYDLKIICSRGYACSRTKLSGQRLLRSIVSISTMIHCPDFNVKIRDSINDDNNVLEMQKYGDVLNILTNNTNASEVLVNNKKDVYDDTIILLGAIKPSLHLLNVLPTQFTPDPLLRSKGLVSIVRKDEVALGKIIVSAVKDSGIFFVAMVFLALAAGTLLWIVVSYILFIQFLTLVYFSFQYRHHLPSSGL